MEGKKRKYYVLYWVLAVTFFVFGCGKNGSKGKEIIQEEITYVTQSISVPEYTSFDGAYSDGSDLHYAATKFNEELQQNETAFYTLKQGAAEPEINFTLTENQRVLNMTMDLEGNTYYFGYTEEVPGNEGSQMMQNMMLYKLDRSGALLLTLDLAEYSGGQEPTVIQGLAVDKENRIIIFTANQNIFVLDPTGKQLFKTRAEGIISNVCSSGGKVFVAYNGIDGAEIREIDVSGKKLSGKLEHNIPGERFYMTAGRNEDLLIATESSVYRYNFELEETVKKFDWLVYDFNGISSGILLPYGENGVLVVNRDYGVVPMRIEATAFKEAVEGEVGTQEKTVLTLGTLYSLPSGIAAEIANFNKNNPEYKIEIKNYNEDYTRLNTEIISGSGPDLLLMPPYRIGALAQRGAVEDLNPYFNRDETLDRSDFQENILEAFETQGHLYGMPLSFTLFTVFGRTADLGDRTAWNLDELIAFAENVPEGRAIFDDNSQSGVLRLLRRSYNNQLVNTENTDNPLDRELLIKMLAFANQFEKDDQYVYANNIAGKLSGGQVMLVDSLVRMGFDYFGCSGLLGEPITYIGYPSEEGNGHLIQSYTTFSISANSKHKDIVWSFISTLLGEAAQMRMEKDFSTKGFQIRKNVLDYHFSWVMENTSSYILFTTSDTSFPTYHFNPGDVREEDILPVRNLIENADTVVMILPDIDKIIEEEAHFYFNGTKPLEEVIDVIENRVRTYVNEAQ